MTSKKSITFSSPEVPWDNVVAFVETVKEYGHP